MDKFWVFFFTYLHKQFWRDGCFHWICKGYASKNFDKHLYNQFFAINKKTPGYEQNTPIYHF